MKKADKIKEFSKLFAKNYYKDKEEAEKHFPILRHNRKKNIIIY